MESRDDQRRGGGNPAPATTYIILSRSGAGYLGSYHKGMNIDNDEFVAMLDDAMAALEKNNIGQREKEEVLYIFFSLKGDVVLV